MADKDLVGLEDSLVALLKQAEERYAADLSAEEELNRLKTSNLVALARLSKAQQEEVYNQTRAHFMEQLEHEKTLHEERLKNLEAEAAVSDDPKKKKKLKKQIEAEKKLIEEKYATEEARAAEAEKSIAKMKKKTRAAEMAEYKKELKEISEDAFGKGKSFSERKEAFKKMGTVKDENGEEHFNMGALMANLSNALGDMVRQLDSTIDSIGKYKGAIDTRLQGSKNKKNWAGSYWEQMSTDMMRIGAVSPLVKQSDLANKISQMVGQGIAFNVEQRATMDVLKDKIATTFNAANGTLLRLVRIQEQDTTAGRLGMESALTSFLNNMYETTEYMQGIADQVKGSLEEAMSLMSGENALSFEYQVQKWLGSLYSTGMSQTAVQGLGGVLGKLASGQLDAVTQGGQGNLVIMAANQAGLSVADLLSNGLNSDTANTLMNAMVDYLAKIYETAGDSKVIQQQMASIYGMQASDLKAAVNLSRSRKAVASNGLTYSSAMKQLQNMGNSMIQRTSIGEMLGNVWENVKYTMSAGIANNPVLYGIYKAANMLSDTVGGIDIPLPLVMGSGLNMGLNVADLMRVAALSGGVLSNIGNIASGIASGGSGWSMLKTLGMSNSGLTAVKRGSGQGLITTGGATVSESGSLVGNSSGDDVQNATMTNATDDAKAQTAEAVDESTETKLRDVYDEVVDIYQLLQQVASGAYTIAVDVKNPALKIDATDLRL